jgi:hypothetical protein
MLASAARPRRTNALHAHQQLRYSVRDDRIHSEGFNEIRYGKLFPDRENAETPLQIFELAKLFNYKIVRPISIVIK